MKVLRILLRNYRGVREAEVRFLSTGATVVEGPNEAGKSSLAEALDVIFEHPHTSRKARALQPVHIDEGAEIEVDVETGPYAFRYYKRYHKSPEARLTVHRPRVENLTGREAHARAQEILEETVDTQLWRALRVLQGEEVALPKLSQQVWLTRALDAAAGGSRKDDGAETLHERVREEFLQYFTGVKGIPLKRVEETRAAAAEAEGALEELLRQQAALEESVRAAERLQVERARLAKEKERLQASLLEREAAVKAVAALERELFDAEGSLKLARGELGGALASEQARKELVQTLEEIDGHRRLHQDELRAVAPRLEDHRARGVVAVDAESACRDRVAGAEARREARRKDVDLLRDEEELTRLRREIEQATAARRASAEASRLLADSRVTKELLTAIELAERAVEKARLELRANGATVSIEAERDLVLEVDGHDRSLSRGERSDLTVGEARALVIPGVARITVRAGSSARALAEALEGAEAKLRKKLEEGGVASPDAAREAQAARSKAEGDRKQAGELLEVILRGRTLEELASGVEELEARTRSRRSTRPMEDPLPASREEAEVALGAMESLVAEAGAALEDARLTRQAVETALLDLERVRHTAEIRAEEAERRHEEVQARLARAREVETDAAVTARREAHEARVQRLEARTTELGAQLLAGEPEERRRLEANARQALDAIERDLRKAQEDRIAVLARLEMGGGEGLEEKLADARARALRAGMEAESLSRRAEAAKLLFDVMSEERDKVRSAYREPLRQAIVQHGRHVFGPTFSVDIGQDLSVERRTLGGISLPFGDLSVGAREQLAIILRLAVASLVSAEGGVPIFIDDALGYSDPERLEVMCALLSRAAQTSQLIVLTCFPERYRLLGGAEVVRLGARSPGP